MKKFLGIVVLGLFLSGNAHADCIQGDCENGYGVYEYSDAKYEGNYKKGKFSGYGKYTWYDDGNVYIGEFKKNKPHGQGKLIRGDGWIWEGTFKKNSFVKGEKYLANSNSKNNSNSQADLGNLINQAKNTCKELGFKEGTEKFTDCSLKLYSQSLDLAAKQNQQVVIQNQGSSSDTIKVFDVVRDRENTMRKAKGLIDGSCTLANYIFC